MAGVNETKEPKQPREQRRGEKEIHLRVSGNIDYPPPPRVEPFYLQLEICATRRMTWYTIMGNKRNNIFMPYTLQVAIEMVYVV